MNTCDDELVLDARDMRGNQISLFCKDEEGHMELYPSESHACSVKIGTRTVWIEWYDEEEDPDGE